ncbi:MAG: hypothetical protein IKB20_02185 [Clostridia bacterium]|nr:hypothetical protein [Clostridia bacterium]
MAKNTLSDDASAMWEEVRAAFETLAEDGQEHTITELADQFEQIKAKYESQDEEIQNRIQKVRDEVMTIVKGNKNVKDQFTPEVRRAIANAIHSAHNLKEVKENIAAVCKANAIEIRTKRDSVSGLSFAEVIDYALQLKQENNDEIFDGLRKTNRSKFFYGELDPTNPSHIAKQWDKTSETQKAEQELAVNGKTITTAYIYKLQSLAHEDLDDAREAADEVRLLADIRDELRRAVKGLAVRAMLVGDAYNPNGSKVTVFETIGTKTTSDLFTTVVNPATANTPNIADLRKAASKVKTERKWAVMTSDLKLLLSERPQGADSHFYTDAELAAQIGVDRVIDRDFIGDVTGLHAVIFDPDEYWVKEKNVIDTAFPEFRDNRQGYIYEINMGGAIHGLESTAVLREA